MDRELIETLGKPTFVDHQLSRVGRGRGEYVKRDKHDVMNCDGGAGGTVVFGVCALSFRPLTMQWPKGS